MAYTTQYVHSGSAVETYLAVDCNTGSTTVTINDATGWPSPTGGQVAYAVIKPGLTGESKFTYTGRSGTTLSGVTWSTDGTTSSASYTAGTATVIRHGLSANEADEANAAVRNTIGKVTTAGDLLVATGANALKRLAIGSAYQNVAANSGATDIAFQASLQSLMTAAGDIVYASSANTPARLAKGSDGQFLTLSSGVPAWASVSTAVVGCRAIKSSSQSINSGTSTAIQFDGTNDWGATTTHDPSSNNTRFVASATGKWRLNANTDLNNATAAGTTTILEARVNGTTYKATKNAKGWNGDWSHADIDVILNLTATDYVEVMLYQNAGVAVSVTNAGGNGSGLGCWAEFTYQGT